MRRFGETGAPSALAASTKEAVENLFRERPPPHHMEALQVMFPMLKNMTKIPPLEGWSVD